MDSARKIEEWRFQAPWRRENAAEQEQIESGGLGNEELKDSEKQQEQEKVQAAREQLMIEASVRFRMF